MSHLTVSRPRRAPLTIVRDEQTLQDYFDYYIRCHRMRKGEAQAMNMIVPPAITGTRPSTDSGRHFLLYPGALVHKFHTSRRNLGLPPVAPTMEKGGTSGDGCAITDDNWPSEVDEVILVRKLGSIFSLRDRRTKVLRQLEMVCATEMLRADERRTSNWRNVYWRQSDSTRPNFTQLRIRSRC
jgi:hypothetical protein